MKAQVVTYWSPEDIAEQCAKTASLLEKGDINTLEDVAEAYASVTHDSECQLKLQTGAMEDYRLTQAKRADVRLDSEGRIQQVFYDFHGAYVNLSPVSDWKIRPAMKAPTRFCASGQRRTTPTP